MKVYLKVFLLYLFLFGCKNYVPPKEYEVEKERIINKSYEAVWQDIISFMGSANIPIKNIDKNSGFIATEFDLGASFREVMDCGEPGSAPGYKQVFENPIGNFNIVVQKISENSTKVTVNVFYKSDLVLYEYNQYSGYYPIKRQRIECNSTGTLERRLLNYLTK